MQYGQNLSNAYSQPQNEHNTMFSNDHKDSILKTKMDREREDGNLYSGGYIFYNRIRFSKKCSEKSPLFNHFSFV